MGNEIWPMIARVWGDTVACSVLYLLLGVESVTRMKLSHVNFCCLLLLSGNPRQYFCCCSVVILNKYLVIQ